MKSLGKFGQFGGMFAPELLYPALEELEGAFLKYKNEPSFRQELQYYLEHFAGRPTPLYLAKNLSKRIGCKVYLKREDLVHGGSHKLNNTLGQVLLAKRMGKKYILTETAAGQHGVATAMAANALGMKTVVFMGTKDRKRQSPNAMKMRILGAELRIVTRGNGVLKDAVDESIVAWIGDLANAYYLLGSTVGPHPFPTIVKHFQEVIGKEARQQILDQEGRLPKTIIACGSGGSNAIGIFSAFVNERDVEFIFVEGGGEGLKGEQHAAAFTEGSLGVFQGAKTIVLQDEYGNDTKTESRSAGLNYPARGPEMAHLHAIGRVKAEYATDQEVIDAYKTISELEGIIPAFETAHAFAALLRKQGTFAAGDVVILNCSGKGDKDLETACKILGITFE